MAVEVSAWLADRFIDPTSPREGVELLMKAVTLWEGSLRVADEVSFTLPAWSNWWVSVILKVTDEVLKKAAVS